MDYYTVENERGITLIAKIKRLDYKNEAGGDPPDKPPNAPDENDENGPAAYSIPVYSTHQITMENVTFYMEEFRIASNGQRVSTMTMVGSNTESMLDGSEQYYSTINELPEPSRSRQKTPDETSEDDDEDNEEPDPPQIYRTDALQIARFHGVMDIRITMKVSVPHHWLAFTFASENLIEFLVQLVASSKCARTKGTVGTSTWRCECICDAASAARPHLFE